MKWPRPARPVLPADKSFVMKMVFGSITVGLRQPLLGGFNLPLRRLSEERRRDWNLAFGGGGEGVAEPLQTFTGTASRPTNHNGSSKMPCTPDVAQRHSVAVLGRLPRRRGGRSFAASLSVRTVSDEMSIIAFLIRERALASLYVLKCNHDD